jgi:tetratricopeptide (TPR) repeat protein
MMCAGAAGLRHWIRAMPTPVDPIIPAQVASLLSMAAGCLRTGRPREALAPLRAAARSLPGNAAILHDLGLACLESGLLGEAMATLRSAVAANPRFADSHLRLGIALEAAGAFDAALESYTRAADEQPSLADARYRAGELLDSLGRSARAVEAFRAAARAAPGTTLGRIAEARALLAENSDAEAQRILRQALAVDGQNAVALQLLGNALADAGLFTEAQDYLMRAIARAPRLAGSYYDIVRCRQIRREDVGLIARMREALELPGLQPSQRSRVHLALGKAAEDLGDFAEAMRQFDSAETLRRAEVRFDLAGFEARVERMIARFTREMIARAPSEGCHDPAPVFIVGLPRSGTTLVEQILSAHPDVGACGELPFWNETGAAWEQGGACGPDPAFLSRAAADYLRILRGTAPDAARVTDKMPLNFQWVGLIHLALPRATIIHCRRCPLDTALSIHQTHFSPRMSFPTGGSDLVGYVRAYQRLSAHWREALPAERFIEIDYESLTREAEPVIRRIVAACALPWNAACLHPERNPRVVKTPSKWQTRQPIYATAVGRWRAYQAWLGPLKQLIA